MANTAIRIGSAYDVHRLEKGEGIILGGVRIPCEFRTVAHSDGDVLLHALAEAVFGALAIGDLGTYFPPEDQKTTGIDSSLILKLALDKARESGYELYNADLSLILEKPKIKDYILPIRENLAKLTGLDIADISVKAGTNERLDDLGEGKGIGCFCSLLLINQKLTKILKMYFK